MTLVIIPRCPRRNLNGRMCAYPAGAGTKHKGWGVCRWHRGQWSVVEETWRSAMELAEQLDMNPLEALLHSVKVAAAHAAWADSHLREAVKKQGGEPGDEPGAAVKVWLVESRRERTLFSKISKAAVDAGVAAALVARVDLESMAAAEAILAAVDSLDLPPDLRQRALEAGQARLMSIAGPEGGDPSLDL